MGAPRILAFGGSLRRDSFNRKLAAIAAEGAREAGGLGAALAGQLKKLAG
jgi:NAD(P)H-dependent FMN reductase